MKAAIKDHNAIRCCLDSVLLHGEQQHQRGSQVGSRFDEVGEIVRDISYKGCDFGSVILAGRREGRTSAGNDGRETVCESVLVSWLDVGKKVVPSGPLR